MLSGDQTGGKQIKKNLIPDIARMQLLLSTGLTLLLIVPALCWPMNEDTEMSNAYANEYPRVREDAMLQNYPEEYNYMEGQNGPYYYAESQGDYSQ